MARYVGNGSRTIATPGCIDEPERAHRGERSGAHGPSPVDSLLGMHVVGPILQTLRTQFGVNTNKLSHSSVVSAVVLVIREHRLRGLAHFLTLLADEKSLAPSCRDFLTIVTPGTPGITDRVADTPTVRPPQRTHVPGRPSLAELVRQVAAAHNNPHADVEN